MIILIVYSSMPFEAYSPLVIALNNPTTLMSADILNCFSLFPPCPRACCGVALWAEFTLDENINSASDSASSANDLVQKAQSTVSLVKQDLYGFIRWI